jgi:hypothetical protein
VPLSVANGKELVFLRIIEYGTHTAMEFKNFHQLSGSPAVRDDPDIKGGLIEG